MGRPSPDHFVFGPRWSMVWGRTTNEALRASLMAFPPPTGNAAARRARCGSRFVCSSTIRVTAARRLSARLPFALHLSFPLGLRFRAMAPGGCRRCGAFLTILVMGMPQNGIGAVANVTIPS